MTTRDFDHAIADYTKAIEINPNYAPAYNSRGRAYTSKGDYVHAVADVTRAGELTPEARPRSTVAKRVIPKAKASAGAMMPVSGNATVAEKPTVAGKADVNKPLEESLPAWVKSTLPN